MVCAGAQPHPAGGVQQLQQRALELQGQIPIAGAVPEGEEAAGKFPLELLLNLVAHLLHGGGGAAVQGKGPAHVQPLGPADEPVRLRAQGGAEEDRAAAAGEMGFQVRPGQEQPALQAHAPLLRGNFCHPVTPPGADRLQQLPGAGLHLCQQGRVRFLRGAPHIAQHFAGIQPGDGNGHGLQQRNPCRFSGLDVGLIPQRGLHLADVGLAQQKHRHPALADAAAHGQGQLAV